MFKNFFIPAVVLGVIIFVTFDTKGLVVFLFLAAIVLFIVYASKRDTTQTE